MNRDQIDSMVEGPRTVRLNSGEEIVIRPFTFGSFGLCKKLGLTMFIGTEQKFDEEGNLIEPEIGDELDEEVFWQIQAFFWMHSQPVNDVLHAVRSGTWKDRVEEFGFDLPIHVMQDLLAEMNRINRLTADAAVEIVAKDDGGSGSDSGAPGN